MLIEMHLLKNYAPSNLNRDDTGSPKRCMFGGYPRARISSQCLKQAIRNSESFKTALQKAGMGIRTRKLPEIVKENLLKQGVKEDFAEAAGKIASGFGNKEGKMTDDMKTAQIMFFTQDDIDSVVNMLKTKIDEAKDLKTFKNIKAKELQEQIGNRTTTPIDPDIALFGRMITSNAFKDVEASMQVAHALSTNKINNEFDFFTAVDDLKGNGDKMEDQGSAMMGDIEFNSACYYEYFSFDTDGFLATIGNGNAKKINLEVLKSTIAGFLEGVIYSSPSGKQNSFAAHQLPDVVFIEMRPHKIPVSYANAFIEPARPFGTKDLVEVSAEKLINHINNITEKFNLEATNRFWFEGREFSNLNPQMPNDATICKDIKGLIESVQNTAISEE